MEIPVPFLSKPVRLDAAVVLAIVFSAVVQAGHVGDIVNTDSGRSQV